MIARRLRVPATALDLYLSLRTRRGAFLLESRGPEGRYTYLGAEPEVVVRYQDGRLDVGRNVTLTDDPLPVLRELLAQHPKVEGPRFRGGFVGYFSYDLVRTMERLPRQHPPSPFPDLELGLYTDWVEFDRLTGEATYHSLGENREPAAVRHERPACTFEPPTPDLTRGQYEAAVAEAKRAIYDGEVFQVVLSRMESAPFRGDLAGFYDHLRQLNPSPYLYLLQHEDRTLAGSSPEMLVRLEGREVTTVPIAGTRPRGRTPEESERLAADLLADEKERAEHNMLVDLARNDVGRVAEVGSVVVPDYLEVQRLSHVQHLVSRVVGTLAPGLDGIDLLRAVFPAGTVSGAPKVRAMELIDRLEATARGPYAGAVGYLSFTGDLDAAIAIRTLAASGGTAHLRAGAGIVADSDPAREFQETVHKLAALHAAIAKGVVV